MRRKRFILALILAALIGHIYLRTRPPETVLPNGFVIRGSNVVLSADGNVLSGDAEFLCFDDRYLIVTSITDGSVRLYDNQSEGWVHPYSRPELRAPGGLLYGPMSCNGYYTWMVGPGIMHDGAKMPFIPLCEYLNWSNPSLKDRAWLERPCFSRRRQG